jgi:hypothetical protein
MAGRKLFIERYGSSLNRRRIPDNHTHASARHSVANQVVDHGLEHRHFAGNIYPDIKLPPVNRRDFDLDVAGLASCLTPAVPRHA